MSNSTQQGRWATGNAQAVGAQIDSLRAEYSRWLEEAGCEGRAGRYGEAQARINAAVQCLVKLRELSFRV